MHQTETPCVTTPPEESQPSVNRQGEKGKISATPEKWPSRILGGTARAGWYLLRKISFICFVVVAAVLILAGLERATHYALTKSHFAIVYPGRIDKARKDFIQPVSHYDYDLTPGICVLYSQGKGNRFEYSNNAGFRDPRPISKEKPPDEFRIFLTGGSTAFGLAASGSAAAATNYYYIEHRETISYLLERILTATSPIAGKKIRVYNTAVWGYSYQHLLLRYITKLRQYKPDLVISLDGANEIRAISAPVKDWDYFQQGQFHGVLSEVHSFSRPGLAAYLTLWLKNNTFLMTFIWRGVDPFMSLETGMGVHQAPQPGNDANRGAGDATREERSRAVAENITAVVRVLEDYHAVLENDGVPHLFSLQPILSLSKKPRHDMETKVESLGEHKQYYDILTGDAYRFLVHKIRESAAKKQFSLLDFTEYFDDTSEWVFSDWCHLTAGANYLIAKELARMIKEHTFRMPLNASDHIDEQDSFFWNLEVPARVVYAPPAVGPEQGPQNMLAGYPVRGVYSSREVADNDRLEVVLDLQQPFSLGRLRLVWDGVSAVPDEWSMDASLDGETWTPWVRGGNKDLDELGWWPAYEYFGAEPVNARYLRYKPIKTVERAIRIRSVNVYR